HPAHRRWRGQGCRQAVDSSRQRGVEERSARAGGRRILPHRHGGVGAQRAT
nr:hypothetical protein [Tanacetum cinerariifolium]